MSSLTKLQKGNNGGWSGLLTEKIIDCLPPADRLSIRLVCTSWCSVASKYRSRHPSTTTLPLLSLLPTSNSPLGFYSLSRRTFIDLDLPRPFFNSRCLGCLDGWLAMVSDHAIELTLIHPVSRAQFTLPTQPQCFLGNKLEDPPLCRVTKVVLSAPPTSINCIVAATVGANFILFCRPADKEWTVFQGGRWPGNAYDDIVFCEGKLFILDFEGRLIVITLDARLRGTISPAVLPTPEMKPWPMKSIYVRHRYLVESSGEILVVVKQYAPLSSLMTFHVFKLEDCRWASLPNLGNRALFVSALRSESISGTEVEGLRANCIYFSSKLPERIAPHGVGVFSLEEDKLEPIQINGGCFLFEPVWVKRSL